MLRALLLGLFLVNASVAQAADVIAERMIGGLKEPWALAFLADGTVLVTERRGRLYSWTETGGLRRIDGVPKVRTGGQGGLLDVVADRDFGTTRTIHFTYAKPVAGGAATALASARLSDDGTRLVDVRDLFVMNQASTSTRHFGSRIAQARDGSLFVSLGERGEDDKAQDPGLHHGKIVHVRADGTALTALSGGAAGAHSTGHRNPQGLTFDLSGRLIAVEHGPRGGDEVNIVRPGRNYGWPVIGYGTHYSGAKVGVGTRAPGMEQPAHYWDPSIAPSGAMVHSGRLFPEWRGHLFVGSLKFDMISRLAPAGGGYVEVERISLPETRRVRDVREAPDGSIWFLSVDRGAAYQLLPAR